MWQGFLGWYMVSSGLDADHLSARPNSTPRVSQYRLAAHLGAALVLYVGMMHTALAARQDWKVAHPELAKGGPVVKEVIQSLARQNAFRRCAWGVAGLVLLTAVSGQYTLLFPSLSSVYHARCRRGCEFDPFSPFSFLLPSLLSAGAFVAGLDAGLIYNEFPNMGESIIPPFPELYDPQAFARRKDGKDGWWRNMLENPTTVQFDHRVLVGFPSPFPFFVSHPVRTR